MRYLILCTLTLLAFNIGIVKAESPSPPKAPKLTQIERSNEFNRIGGCESTGSPNGEWDYHAKNPNSSASGVFQFINSSWYRYGKELWGEDFYTKNIWSEDNIELAWYVYNKYGTGDWASSHSCWKGI